MDVEVLLFTRNKVLVIANESSNPKVGRVSLYIDPFSIPLKNPQAIVLKK
jgi:hypothetical protein